MLLVAVWPAVLLIYFLYHPILELAHARAARRANAWRAYGWSRSNGGLPGAGCHPDAQYFSAARFSFRFLYLVGLTTCMISAQRLRIGDMAAGTVLVLDTAPSVRNHFRACRHWWRSTGLDAGLVELLSELLERWSSLSARAPRPRSRAHCSRVPSTALSSQALARCRRCRSASATARVAVEPTRWHWDGDSDGDGERLDKIARASVG
jgi:hypothetical protein